ncbi:MAG TPA: hypothetical protein ENN67_05470 [Firmicutes bacterium]|nr:hypothetical protein [Bacillota bacterium]
MEFIVVFLIWLFCGWVCSSIAESKGYDKNLAWAVGFFTGIIGIFIYAGLKDKNDALRKQ